MMIHILSRLQHNPNTVNQIYNTESTIDNDNLTHPKHIGLHVPLHVRLTDGNKDAV